MQIQLVRLFDGIGRFPVQNPMGAWPGLYEPLL